MKKIFVLLPFGLLGGVITFLGGLAGKVEFSILAVRSLLAVVISIVFFIWPAAAPFPYPLPRSRYLSNYQ